MTRGNPLPKRSLGQNFLQDQGTARKIVSSLEAVSNVPVLEIGPGHGALTRWLVDTPAQIFALEKDVWLALAVKSQWPQVTVLAADAMRFAWERLGGPWSLIGNLPYNVASPIIWDVTSRLPRLFQAVFMVQKEVADRLTATPGNRVYGGLSAWVQSHVRIRRLFVVGPEVFRPRPKVDSAVIRLTPRPPETNRPDGPALRQLLNTCFQQRRKQLKTILRPVWSDTIADWLHSQGLRPESRPEELSPPQFQTLAAMLAASKS
ncbi:MAG TPA: ribosomal RNA small subunit methyltransferase A [Desulfonatronum sp.]|mgnify:CR=1 FL=1|nr:ribosomal RNA small subunit methyltransferase A [Desulfonatronum sp.]